MKQEIFFMAILVLFFLTACKKDNTSQEIQIEVIKIGNQVWMKKNLDVTKYSNGDTIPEVTDSTEWVNLTTGAWCYYENNSANGAVYGRLYNFYAVHDPRGLAPAGWHIPDLNETFLLADSLGGFFTAGGKMKEQGTAHWQNPNTGADNSSGFTALPGGIRYADAGFKELGFTNYTWTSTLLGGSYNGGSKPQFFFLTSESGMKRDFEGKWGYGISVRCLKD